MVVKVTDYLTKYRQQKLEQKERDMQEAKRQDQIKEASIGLKKSQTKKVKEEKEGKGKEAKAKKDEGKINTTQIRQEVFDRHDDCIIFSRDEKELIAAAFKFRLNEIRKAIKDVNIVLGKSKFEPKKPLIQFYKAGLMEDLVSNGKKFIDIIDNDCIKVTGSTSGLIFFMKLKADIYRYMTEFSIGKNYTEFKEHADTNYKIASLTMKYWRQKKMGINPEDDKISTLRLSLSLNYAVFMYDIKNEKKQALRNLKKLI